MNTCAKCGFDNPTTNKFCQNCGTVLATPNQVLSDLPETTDKLEPDFLVTEPNVRWEHESADLPVVDQVAVDTAISSGEISNGDLTPDLTPQSIVLDQPLVNQLEPQKPDPDVTAPDLVEVAPPQIKLTYAAVTDVGKLRDHNEDGFRCFTQTMVTDSHHQGKFTTTRGLFVLCDGMGGHDGGEVASAMALDAIADGFKPFWTAVLPGEQKLREIIANANQTIFNRNESESRREAGRMGTTLLILATYNQEVAIAHVGDSRIYQVTADGLQQLTRDHEVAISLIDQGVAPEIALARNDAHQLTQAIGPNMSQNVDPDIKFLSIETPTLFLLCSDGLCDNDVVETHWQEYLRPLLEPEVNLNDGTTKLVQLGNNINGYDNITAIAASYQFD